MPWLLNEGLVVCSDCGEEKPQSEFPLKRSHGGKYAYYFKWCKSCERVRHKAWRDANPDKMAAISRRATLKQYGLTEEDYQALLQAQGGLCAICRQPPSGNGASKRNLVIDHDHDTGVVRGLLCDGCNRTLGIMGEDPQRLRAAATYLERAADALVAC